MRSSDGIGGERFLRLAEDVVKEPLALNDYETPELKGGVIALMEKGDVPRYLLQSEIGTCNRSKAIKDWQQCEQQTRLLWCNGGISSWPLMNVRGVNQNAGAITAPADSEGSSVGKTIIVSVTGFSARGNEAVALVIALVFGWIVEADIRQFVAISSNYLIRPLAEACRRYIHT